ncbi:hypothetical protein [Thioclava sp. GXIMD4216]|uniref:Uncharacterized protein n=1 Tax=Thioclava litoralis TaxID=3076557 RepID=A0ABZ1DY70_9RHOB|nr:hypothetical protein RPE78_07360 [Thioclava sp. FTW29]
MIVEYSRLQAGEWVVVLQSAMRPALTASYRATVLAEGDWTDLGDGRWRLRQGLPVDLLEDGTQSLLLSDAESGVVASLSIAAGEMLVPDLAAQVDRLQAELDLLKRAFRDHCRQSHEG